MMSKGGYAVDKRNIEIMRNDLYAMRQFIENAQNITADNGDEFIVIPKESSKKLAESLLLIANRLGN